MSNPQTRNPSIEYPTSIAICLTLTGPCSAAQGLHWTDWPTCNCNERNAAEQPRQSIERAQEGNQAVVQRDLLLRRRTPLEHATVPPPGRDRSRVEGPDPDHLEAGA